MQFILNCRLATRSIRSVNQDGITVTESELSVLRDELFGTRDEPLLGEALSRAFMRMAGHSHGHRTNWKGTPILRIGK